MGLRRNARKGNGNNMRSFICIYIPGIEKKGKIHEMQKEISKFKINTIRSSNYSLSTIYIYKEHLHRS
jgi:hypothetical protein